MLFKEGLKPYVLRFVVVVLLLIVSGGISAAQDQIGSVMLEAECTGNQVHISVDVRKFSDFPANWVGWIVQREAIGTCEPIATITDLMPFPDDEESYNFYHRPNSIEYQHQYRARPMKSDGSLGSFSTPDFLPAYYSFAYTTCGDAPAAKGTIESNGWSLDFIPCDNNCWGWLSFLSGDLSELEELAGTGVVVDIWGNIEANFEGPYLVVDHWTWAGTCGVVANESLSWGGLKSTYR